MVHSLHARRLLVALVVVSASLVSAEEMPLTSWLRRMAKRETALESYFDPSLGLAIVPANCGDNDDPAPPPRRVCGGGAMSEMQRLARELRRRFSDIGKLSCRAQECVVSGTSEWDAALHLSIDHRPPDRRVIAGWFEVCAASAGAERQERVNRRREAAMAGKPCF